MEHEVDFVQVEVTNHGQWHVVVGINEHQVLGEKDVANIISFSIKDGNSRVSLLADLRDCLEIQNGV